MRLKFGFCKSCGLIILGTALFFSNTLSILASQSSGMTVSVAIADEENEEELRPMKFWLERDGKRKSLKVLNQEAGAAELLIKGRLPVGTYHLYRKTKGSYLNDLDPLDYCFEILGPSIDKIDYSSLDKGSTVTLQGMYFGLKPKVYFVYRKTEDGRDIRRKCKILKKNYEYDAPSTNKAKGKSPMDPETGISELKVLMPKLRGKTLYKPRFVVKTRNGQGTAPISTINREDSTTRGKLISHNYRDSIKADKVWDYLLHSMADGWLERTLADLLCKDTKLRKQSYRYDLELHTIVYWTVNGKNEPIMASGVVILPKGLTSAPLLSFQHGTMLMKSEAPSVSNGAEMAFAVTYAAAEGFVTSIPDHAGLGVAAIPYSEIYHPYCQADPIAWSDADMIIALKSFLTSYSEAQNNEDSAISLDERVFLAGYSEGGYATLGLMRELEANPDYYEIQGITACGPMAGPYSLSNVMLDRLMSDKKFRVPYFAPYLLVTMNNDYQLYAKPSDYLASPYDTTIPPLIDGYHSSSAVNAAMPSVVKNCLLPDISKALTNHQGPFFDGLAKNDLIDLPSPGWVPVAPVMMVHGKTDDCVLWENSELALAYFQNQMGKSDISLQTLKPNALIIAASLVQPTHVLYAPYAVGEVWTWFHEVLAGKTSAPPPSAIITTKGDAKKYMRIISAPPQSRDD